jgi:hypothetical protein
MHGNYDPMRQKEFFHNVVEMFRQISNPAMPRVAEPSFELKPRVVDN